MGAVDYVPVPVIPEVLRAKVRIFAELYRKTRQLEQLNQELERRVAERTAELEASTARLLQSEQRRSLALAAGQMGSWEWDLVDGRFIWDDGQYRIFGVDPATFELSVGQRPGTHPSRGLETSAKRHRAAPVPQSPLSDRISRRAGPTARSAGASERGGQSSTPTGNVVRISGVTVDITDRKEAEERQVLLAREVDHRARNALGVGPIDRASDARRQHQGLCRTRSRGGWRRWRARTRCSPNPLARRRSRPVW